MARTMQVNFERSARRRRTVRGSTPHPSPPARPSVDSAIRPRRETLSGMQLRSRPIPRRFYNPGPTSRSQRGQEQRESTPSPIHRDVSPMGMGLRMRPTSVPEDQDQVEIPNVFISGVPGLGVAYAGSEPGAVAVAMLQDFANRNEALSRAQEEVRVTEHQRRKRLMDAWLLRMARPRRNDGCKYVPISACTICMEDSPLNPVGCSSCNQLIGCRLCVANWFTSAVQYHPGCPLCRFKWTRNEPAVFSVLESDPTKT